MQIGINLDAARWYGRQKLFGNAFRESAPLWSGSNAVMDADGNLIQGPGNKLLARDGPPGRWDCYFEGDALKIHGEAVSNVVVESNHISFDVGPGTIALKASDPVSGVQVFPAGARDGWHPQALEFFGQFPGPLRMMVLQEINNSEIVNFEDFRPATYVTQASNNYDRRGMAPALLIDLANRLNKDLWLCIPHLATDDCVRRLAELTAAGLNSWLRIYLEYSNEVWNWGFRQSRYADEQGKLIDLGSNRPTPPRFRFYAQRSVEIFNIWKSIFGDRLIRVLASQSANPRRSEQIIEWSDTYKYADALAIAPYIGGHVKAAETAEQVFEKLRDPDQQHSIPDAARLIARHKALADAHGLRLFAYEGGQHLVAQRDPELTETFRQANLHSEMGNIYKEYFLACGRSGVDVMCHLSAVFKGGKHGQWGLVEEMGTTSPKLEAVLKFIEVDKIVGPIRDAAKTMATAPDLLQRALL